MIYINRVIEAVKDFAHGIGEVAQGKGVIAVHNPKNEQRTSGQITIDGGVPLTDEQLRNANMISRERRV